MNENSVEWIKCLVSAYMSCFNCFVDECKGYQEKAMKITAINQKNPDSGAAHVAAIKRWWCFGALVIYDAVRDILSLTARALHKYMQFESTLSRASACTRRWTYAREKMWRVKQSQPDRLACVDLQISGFRRIAHSDVRERIITLARLPRASKNISRDGSYQRRYQNRPLSCVATFFRLTPSACL